MGKIKEFLSKHKRVRRLLVALVLFVSFFVGFCFGYTAQTVKEQGNVGTAAIRASAEEAKTEVEFPVNYCNTFLFKEQTVNGVTLSVDKNGVIYLSGTPTKEQFTFDCMCAAEYIEIFSELLGTTPFFYHSELSGVRFEFCLVIDGENCYYPRTIVPNYKLPTGELSFVGMYLVIDRPEMEPFNNDAYYLSLYKNANSNFYTPSLLGYYDMAYNAGKQDGHDAGKQEGYDEGYKDASDTLNLGVLYGATVSGKFSYTNGQTVTLASGKPDFSYNGLNFNSIWGKYYHYNNDTENTLESVEMTLNFKTSFQYDGFPLYFLGDSDVMSATFISTANKRYNADIEKYNDTAIGEDYALIRIRENEKEDGIEVKALTIYFGRAVDTLYNANVLSKSGGYLNGYDNGYNAGFSNGKTEGHIEGRNEGYDKGKTEGYEVGYNEGVTQQMTSSVGAFFKSIYSVFDINIFGPIKIGHFIFIPLVLSLLLLILKLFRG